MTDLAAGQVSFAINGGGTAAPLIEAGRLRALATANGGRLARYPELPAMAELGGEGVLPGSWFGLAAPAAMLDPVLRALYAAAAAALAAERGKVGPGLRSPERPGAPALRPPPRSAPPRRWPVPGRAHADARGPRRQ